MRLEKFLALAGVASRRASKALVLEGHVKVNGAIVSAPGMTIEEDADDVRVNGSRVRLQRRLRHILLHKPKGYLCTAKDTHDRKTVFDLLPPMTERLFPIGRLDADAEGLLLLTNDGDLALRLTHPRYEVPKTYIATVKGIPSEDALNRLRNGVSVEGGKTARAQVSVLHRNAAKSDLRIVIHEGRKRQVKWMCFAVGHPVKKLRRVQFGPLVLGKLPKGAHRELTAAERVALRRSVGLDEVSDRVDRKRDPK